jgi:predicted nucleic-acid-binding protein
MVAVDTNVLVRWLVADDALQTAAAEKLVAENTIFVSTTVLLETEWVLRDAFGFSRDEIFEQFSILVSLENCILSDEAALLAALDWFRAGLDFADAVHLALTPSKARFASFDARLKKRAARLEHAPKVITP